MMSLSLSQSEANRTVRRSVCPSRRMRCRGWQLALKTPSVECRPRSRCRSRLGLASRVVGNAWQARTRPARVFVPLTLSLPFFLPCWIQIWWRLERRTSCRQLPFPSVIFPIFLAGCEPTAAFVYVVCPVPAVSFCLLHHAFHCLRLSPLLLLHFPPLRKFKRIKLFAF